MRARMWLLIWYRYVDDKYDDDDDDEDDDDTDDDTDDDGDDDHDDDDDKYKHGDINHYHFHAYSGDTSDGYFNS